MDALADADPTSTISAVVSGIRLISLVLKVAPGLKNAASNAAGAVKNASAAGKTGRRKSTSFGGGGAPELHKTTTAGAVVAGVDPESETRAYETVNYVLRSFGTRIGEAGLVDTQALAKALSHATEHIEVKLFSIEVNRLFQSLASKLGDPVLVSSVFTSIYFLGALTAELSRSLPNYKESYMPLGPRLIQQLFRSVIGEDAFKENLTANLAAFKTLATTAGLLRPTDIGYAIFPGFPSFSPCRYSSRSSADVRSHRVAYEKLVKHFGEFGFPQPVVRLEIGEIKEWRFLAGDKNTQTFEVEKADKHIGENFGYVLHWLVCSADRMSSGVAMIAYFSQHIELIHWLGSILGCAILNAGTDLDMSGPHSKLDKKARAIFNTWVVLMPSEKEQANRKASSAAWSQNQAASKIDMPLASNALAAQGHMTKKPPRSNATPPAAMPAQTPARVPTRKPAPSLAISPKSKRTMNEKETSSQASRKQQERLSPSTSTASSPPLSPSSPRSPMFPPYSPTASITSHSTTSSHTFPTTRPMSVVRRRAPAPPKKFTDAKARYDFQPEDGNDEELAFCEGDDIEIVEKSADLNEEGWCRARIKGSTKVGLAPLEYLEEEKKAGSLSPGAPRPTFPLAHSEFPPNNAGTAGNVAFPGKLHVTQSAQYNGGSFLKEQERTTNNPSVGVIGGAIRSAYKAPGARNGPSTRDILTTPSTRNAPPKHNGPSRQRVTPAHDVSPAPNILPAHNVLPTQNAVRPGSRGIAPIARKPHASHPSQHIRKPTNTKPPPKSNGLSKLSHTLQQMQHAQHNTGGSNSSGFNDSGQNTGGSSSYYSSTTSAPFNSGIYSGGPFNQGNPSSNYPMYGGLTMDPSMMYSGGGSSDNGTMDLAALSLMANSNSTQTSNTSFGSDPATPEPSATPPNDPSSNLDIPDMSQLQDPISGASTPFFTQGSLDTDTNTDPTTDPSTSTYDDNYAGGDTGTNPYDDSYYTTSAMTNPGASPVAALPENGGLTPPPDPNATPLINSWDPTSYSAPYTASDDGASANAASTNDVASEDLSSADAAEQDTEMAIAEDQQSTAHEVSQSAIAQSQQFTANEFALGQNAIDENDEEDDPVDNDYSEDDNNYYDDDGGGDDGDDY